MNTFLFVINPQKYSVEPENVEGFLWSCTKDIKAGDRIFVYLTGNIGIKYEWMAVSEPEPDIEWKYLCYAEYKRAFEPAITLNKIRQNISADEWKPPYQNFRGYRSIKIPDYIAEKLLLLR